MIKSLRLTKKDHEAFKMMRIIKDRLLENNTATINGVKTTLAQVDIQVTFTDRKTGTQREFTI